MIYFLLDLNSFILYALVLCQFMKKSFQLLVFIFLIIRSDLQYYSKINFRHTKILYNYLELLELTQLFNVLKPFIWTLVSFLVNISFILNFSHELIQNSKHNCFTKISYQSLIQIEYQITHIFFQYLLLNLITELFFYE